MKKEYACNECDSDSVMVSKQALEYHIQNLHGKLNQEHILKCMKCDKSFSRDVTSFITLKLYISRSSLSSVMCVMAAHSSPRGI